jgi:hypothetical protein
MHCMPILPGKATDQRASLPSTGCRAVLDGRTRNRQRAVLHLAAAAAATDAVERSNLRRRAAELILSA